MWKSPFYECISVRVVVMKKLSSCKGIIAVILFSLILTCFAEDTFRSVGISGSAGSAVLPLTTVTSASPTSMEVQLAPLAQVLAKESLALEHTNFTVTFVPTRAENGLSALGAQNITLRYNTHHEVP